MMFPPIDCPRDRKQDQQWTIPWDAKDLYLIPSKLLGTGELVLNSGRAIIRNSGRLARRVCPDVGTREKWSETISASVTEQCKAIGRLLRQVAADADAVRVPSAWLDEGTPPPTAGCRTRYRQIVEELATRMRLVPDSVTASREGGISAAYNLSNGYRLDLDVDNDTDAFLVVSDGHSVCGSFVVEDVADLVLYVAEYKNKSAFM